MHSLNALMAYAQDALGLEPDAIMFAIPLGVLALACIVLALSWRMMRVLGQPPSQDP